MVAIPTTNDEDAKRPNRERESLVGEQSRIVNRMKATLTRLGIRGFNPKLKKAAERLDGLRTPEGEPIPPNTLACVATWCAGGWSVIRYVRSRMLGWSVLSMRPVMDRTPWCACWRA